MKTLENITIYKCDHCSKKLFRKHAMTNHENKCSQNPKNIRACFDCAMCESVKIKYEPEPQIYDGDLSESTAFKCMSKNVFMYPPKMEYSEKGIPSYVEYQNEEISQEKMPLTCDIKKRQSDDMELFFSCT
jgi:hypothetical protein